MRTRLVLLLVSIAVLAGCASDIPRPIREAPPNNPGIAQVLTEPEAFRQQSVRWGGVIAAVENRKEETWIEVVERPLDGEGRPQRTDRSGGRFIAKAPEFLDPSVYARNRAITVAGVLENVITRDIGEHPFRYPLIRVSNVYLWPEQPATVHHYYYYPPYWYDPWYWYPPPPRPPPPPPPPPPPYKKR